MKKLILLWLLIAAALCGCGTEPEMTMPTGTPITAIPTAPPEGYYDADSALEQQTKGAVRVYSLSAKHGHQPQTA